MGQALPQVVARLRGRAGSAVKLRLSRAGAEGSVEQTVERRPVDVPGAAWQMLPGRPRVAHLAFRVVQESLTNALRYAPGADVRIVIRVDETERGLAVRVENDRTAQHDSPLAGTGRGLVGLRERIQTLGGQFSAGATGVGGWAVEARLPGS